MTTKERLDRHDRQIAAIRDLVHEGMRLLIATRKDIRVLINAQKELMATMKRGMNGHRKRKLARKRRAGVLDTTKEAARALRFAGCYLGDLQ
jgi:hypothetical protein